MTTAIATHTGTKELDAQAEATRAALSAQPHRESLLSYVQACWDEAKRWKDSHITPALIDAYERYEGKYSPEKLAKIKKTKGSEICYNVSATKCNSAAATFTDVLLPIGDKPWSLELTPVPELPSDMHEEVVQEIIAEFMEQGDYTQAEVEDRALNLHDERLKRLTDKAKRKVKKMEQKIEDQLIEGGFPKAVVEFIRDYTKFAAAFLKGPTIRNKKRRYWEGTVLKSKFAAVPIYDRVSPFNMYPSPNATDCNDSYLIELINFEARDLAAMRGLQNWNTASIDAALWQHEFSNSAQSDLRDPAAARAEGRPTAGDTDNNAGGGGPIKTKCFWGAISGHMLKEWRVPGTESLESLNYYDVNIYMAYDQIMYAVLNPDELGRRPYYKDSYQPEPGNFWGKGIPQKVSVCEDVVRASYRAAVNNAAVIALPQRITDLDALDESTDPNTFWPGKNWNIRSTRTGSNKRPVDFFQPESRLGDLLDLGERFEDKAQDASGQPKFAHADGDIGAAGATYGGLSILQGNADKGTKQNLVSIDTNVLRPLLQYQYDYNMMFLDDDSLKADAQVVPRGVLATLGKEQAQVELNNWLQNTSNPLDIELLGLDTRVKVLLQATKALRITVDEAAIEARVRKHMDSLVPPAPPGAGAPAGVQPGQPGEMAYVE